MRPPKKDGQATTVFFHVTVMGLDSIDETSMVRWVGRSFFNHVKLSETVKNSTKWFFHVSIILDLRSRYFLRPNVERPPPATAREHDFRIPAARGGVAEEHVAAGFLLQKRQISDFPDDDDPQSLHVAVQRQNHPVHGKTDAEAVVRDELHHLPARYTGVQAADGKS